MTTLQTFGFTIAGGSAVLAVSLGVFGHVVSRRLPAIAPCATARPRDVIYNPHPHHSSQNRGGPMLGWIPWTLSLTYDTMMQGVPGTGTREGGLSGSLLKVNLDGICLLRFHALGMRISALATALLLLLVMPLYYTAQCYSDSGSAACGISEDRVHGLYCDVGSSEQQQLAQNMTLMSCDIVARTINATDLTCNLTNLNSTASPYTTASPQLYCIRSPDGLLYNLPSNYTIFSPPLPESVEVDDGGGIILADLSTSPPQAPTANVSQDVLYYDLKGMNYTIKAVRYNLTNYERLTLANVPSIADVEQVYLSIFRPQLNGVLARLYFVVFTFWIILAYTMYQLKQEWIQMLALRRVYWLESDIWGERREELKNTLLFEESARKKRAELKHFTFDDENERKAQQVNMDESEKHLLQREPWIPHPEQRDTVPNVALYSLLVGGLPSLPNEASDAIDAEATINFSKRESIDWQLSLTSTFFDHCVPNQPGFSSSVAAVTIIPGASELSVAWRKWYAAAAKLRRLRFIRSVIAERRRYEIEVDDDEEPYDVESGVKSNGTRSLRVDPDSEPSHVTIVEDTPRGIYRDASKNKDYYRQVLGSLADEGIESHVFEALNFGPEQAAVYSREFAQAAAPCCPKGMFEDRIRRAPIDVLIEMERKAAAEVHEANLSLREARQRATLFELEDPGNTHEHPTSPEPMPPSSPDRPSPKKGHRPNKSLDGADTSLPLGLESELYQKASTPSSLDNGKADRPATIKKHGRIKSIEQAKLPSDLGLERQFYTRSTREIENKHQPQDNNISGESGKFERGKSPHRRGKSMDDSMVRPSTLAGTLTKRTSTDIAEPVKKVSFDDNAHPSKEPAMLAIHEGSESRPSEHGPATASDVSCREEDRESNQYMRRGKSSQWTRVTSIVNEAVDSHSLRSSEISDGRWHWPNVIKMRKQHMLKQTGGEIKNWAKAQSSEAVKNIMRESTYAVVTFTSRQAAVAARHCLADGRGTERWVSLSDIPIPPLADAAACDVIACRNCCRPVSLSINNRQKNWRNMCSYLLLGLIYVSYTFPLLAAQQLINPGELDQLFPKVKQWSDDNDFQIITIVSGFLNAMIWTSFFALCPLMFKTIANFGSQATSAAQAEYSALQYYWWFMVLTAFSGTSLGTIVTSGLNGGLTIGSQVRDILRSMALTIPASISASWLNWIIYRFLITLPVMYLLQLNTLLLSAAGLKCCTRMTRGGGPGGPTPYRIYVDSGVVLMCLIALGPASPLIGPACLIYFAVCQPLLRRNLIFLYRAKFDGGGFRWPFIFDMVISTLILGEILLVTQMGLKQALGPAIAAGLPLIPTILFGRNMKHQYKQAFMDAALLQTSLLDGWDTAEISSMEKREEFRRFLVDAHKAAYVPVCVSGTDTDDFLTAEPALVVPQETDLDFAMDMDTSEGHLSAAMPTGNSLESQEDPTNCTYEDGVPGFGGLRNLDPSTQARLSMEQQSVGAYSSILSEHTMPSLNLAASTMQRRASQHGATLRRAVYTMSAMRRRSMIGSSGAMSAAGSERQQSGGAHSDREDDELRHLMASPFTMTRRAPSPVSPGHAGRSVVFPSMAQIRQAHASSTRTISGGTTGSSASKADPNHAEKNE